jgi:hypothetical protein
MAIMYELGDIKNFEGESLLIGKSVDPDGVLTFIGYKSDDGGAGYGGISAKRVRTGGIDYAGNACPMEVYVDIFDWGTQAQEDQFEGIRVYMVDDAGTIVAPFISVVFELIRNDAPHREYRFVNTSDGTNYFYTFTPTDKRVMNAELGKLFKDNINNQIPFRLKCYIQE